MDFSANDIGDLHRDDGVRVLVADDECYITDSIAYALQREGYIVCSAYDGKQAFDKINEFKPHILILDIMMPEYNGYEVCRRIDPDTTMGILMLTAKSDLMDKVIGLELGADDYMTKPFDLAELLARVRSLVRRLKKANLRKLKSSEEIIKDKNKGVVINTSERLVYVDGENIEFKPKEFDLLVFLTKNIQRVFTREKILEMVWNMEYLGGTRTIDIHILRIRKKLGIYSNMIVTVPKIGYKAVNFDGDLL